MAGEELQLHSQVNHTHSTLSHPGNRRASNSTAGLGLTHICTPTLLFHYFKCHLTSARVTTEETKVSYVRTVDYRSRAAGRQLPVLFLSSHRPLPVLFPSPRPYRVLSPSSSNPLPILPLSSLCPLPTPRPVPILSLSTSRPLPIPPSSHQDVIRNLFSPRSHVLHNKPAVRM